MLKIAVSGATGRMGQALLAELQSADVSQLQLGAAVHRADGPDLGQDSGLLAGLSANQIMLSGELDADSFDVLVDFTLPEQCLRNLQFCCQHGKPMVIGTTGLNAAGQQEMARAGQDIPVLYSANMSVGVNLCFYLLEQAARVLGPVADIEIQETHHRNKVDSPSGTALQMGRVIAQSLDLDFDRVAEFDRNGQVGPRATDSIGFASTRAGDVVGDHTVLFSAPGERIEISHKASSRQIYAAGALRAAAWLGEKDKAGQAGLYDMLDVLGLRDGSA